MFSEPSIACNQEEVPMQRLCWNSKGPAFERVRMFYLMLNCTRGPNFASFLFNGILYGKLSLCLQWAVALNTPCQLEDKINVGSIHIQWNLVRAHSSSTTLKFFSTLFLLFMCGVCLGLLCRVWHKEWSFAWALLWLERNFIGIISWILVQSLPLHTSRSPFLLL